MKPSKMDSLKFTLLKIAFIPMVLLTLVVTTTSSYFVAKSLDEQVRESMTDLSNSMLISFNEMYPGSYTFAEGADGIYLFKGEHQFNGDFSYIDSIKRVTGCDVTVCYLNFAVITTLMDPDGNRLIGGVENDRVYENVITNGKSDFYENAMFNGEEYFAFYTPLRDDSGNVIGMISVSMPTEFKKSLVWQSIEPLIVCAVLAILIVSLIVIRFSDGFITTIKKIQDYMKAIAKEDFRKELDPIVAKRNDELGQMAQSAVKMSGALRKKVEEDLLTGLYNRRVADKRIRQSISDYNDKGVRFCLAIGDIDFFKKVNDTYGHEAGDKVLIAVAKTLKENMAGKGYAIRWGGEEFILVFEGFSLDKAIDDMNALLDKMRALEIVDNETTTIRITMTFGLVECDEEGAVIDASEAEKYEPDALKKAQIDKYISSADAKLYYGKEHGRNQLVTTMNNN